MLAQDVEDVYCHGCGAACGMEEWNRRAMPEEVRELLTRLDTFTLSAYFVDDVKKVREYYGEGDG